MTEALKTSKFIAIELIFNLRVIVTFVLAALATFLHNLERVRLEILFSGMSNKRRVSLN